MYTTNYKTKKALKAAVAAGKQVAYFQLGLGGNPQMDGKIALAGPLSEGAQYPSLHSWYALATVKDGVIIKVS